MRDTYVHMRIRTHIHIHIDKGGVALIKVRVMASSTMPVFLSPPLEHLQRITGHGETHLDNHYIIPHCTLTLTPKIFS